MMDRLGLKGMESFEQDTVRLKELQATGIEA
jgi:hypothetical protein